MTDNSKRAYHWTLALFAAVAAALVIWFQRHIEPFVTETLIIGGTISLWGLWKLGWSFFTRAGGEDEDDLTKRFLGTKGARNVLWFLALVALLLHLFTASIYLRPEGAASGEDEFTVQAMEGNKVFMGPFKIHPGEVLGHPFFPSFRGHDLVYQILEPRGFEPLPQTLRPWSAHDIKVPGSFDRKVFHNMVLVPDTVLFSDLPPQGQDGGPRYYLALTSNGETALLQDFSQQLVVTGSAQPDLPNSATVKKDEGVRRELSDHFSHDAITAPQVVVAALMDSEVAQLASRELEGGATVTVEVGTWDTEGGKKLRAKEFSCVLKVPSDGVLHISIIGLSMRETCK
jgi:hypothetical protein